MKNNIYRFTLLFSVLLQSCGLGSEEGQEEISIIQATTTGNHVFSTDSPEPTSTLTILPTLAPTPTIDIPTDLETCFSSGDPLRSYGCLVTTYAGGDEYRYGDGGIAIEAEFAEPTDVVVSEDGYLYIADSLHSKIRVVSPDGIITTYAGRGPNLISGFSMDGLPANETGLRRPAGLAFGPDGLLYFVDSKTYSVRRIEADGTIRTVAGDLTPGIFDVEEPFGDGQPAVSEGVWLSQPSAIAFDSAGNLYIADTDNDRIRRVDLDGIISTISISDLSKPQAISVDENDRLIIAQSGPLHIFDLKTGGLQVIENDQLWGLTSLAVSQDNRIYYANPSKNQVGSFRITDYVSDEGTIKPIVSVGPIIAGRGIAGYEGDGRPAKQALLNHPYGVAIDKDGNLYIADRWNHVIRKVTDGIIETVAGGNSNILSPYPIPWDQTIFETTNGMAFDDFGNLFIASIDLPVIRKIDTNGYVTLVAGNGIPAYGGEGVHPLSTSVEGIVPVFDAVGNLFFVGKASDTAIVQRISPGEDGVINGSSDEILLTVVGDSIGMHSYGETSYNVIARQAVFGDIKGMAFDSQGNLFLADWVGNRILKVSPGADGVISGEEDEMVTVFAGADEETVVKNGTLATQANLGNPLWIAIDSKDNIYYQGGFRGQSYVGKIDHATGTIEILENIISPYGCFMFDKSDNLFYTDSISIYRIDAISGNKTRVAGTGDGGWTGLPVESTGDGGDARDATFQSIYFFTIDFNGDLYIDDSGNYRIRKLFFIMLD